MRERMKGSATGMRDGCSCTAVGASVDRNAGMGGDRPVIVAGLEAGPVFAGLAAFRPSPALIVHGPGKSS